MRNAICCAILVIPMLTAPLRAQQATSGPATVPTSKPATKPVAVTSAVPPPVPVVVSTKPASRPAADEPVSFAFTKAKLPASPGYHILSANATFGDQSIPLRVGVFLPPAYFKDKDQDFPLVVALHNRGFRGDDGQVTQEGLTSLWIRDTDQRYPTTQPLVVRTQARFVGIAPQCPANMEFDTPPFPKIVSALIDTVTNHYRIDQQRVYLTGFSYGGTNTWRIAEEIPDKFAAIAPISARQMADPQATVNRLKELPIYLASGTDEWATPTCKIMAEALKAQQHGDYVYRLVDGGNHFCYGNIYQDPSFWEWLFARKRRGATTRPGRHPSTQAYEPAATQPTSQPQEK